MEPGGCTVLLHKHNRTIGPVVFDIVLLQNIILPAGSFLCRLRRQGRANLPVIPRTELFLRLRHKHDRRSGIRISLWFPFLCFPETVEIAVGIYCFYFITFAKRETRFRFFTGFQRLSLISLLGLNGDPFNKMFWKHRMRG